jgi:hypothetical protein
VALINLFGFLDGDFVGRMVVADTEQTVQGLADQLHAWASRPRSPALAMPTVTDASGVALDPTSTLAAAGLSAGDLFHVRDSER